MITTTFGLLDPAFCVYKASILLSYNFSHCFLTLFSSFFGGAGVGRRGAVAGRGGVPPPPRNGIWNAKNKLKKTKGPPMEELEKVPKELKGSATL